MAKFPEDFDSQSVRFNDHLALQAAIGRIWIHDPSLAEFVGAEMRRAVDDSESNVLCVGTDGDVTVTVILVPQALISNETGPVLLPSANPHHVIAVASVEVASRRAIECLAMESPGEAQIQWDSFVNWFFDRSLALARLGARPEVPKSPEYL